MVRVGMAEVIKELLAFVISCLAQRPPHALHDQLRRQCSKTRLEPLSAVGVLLVIWAVQQESGRMACMLVRAALPSARQVAGEPGGTQGSLCACLLHELLGDRGCCARQLNGPLLKG